jgi:hypothetical protein
MPRPWVLPFVLVACGDPPVGQPDGSTGGTSTGSSTAEAVTTTGDASTDAGSTTGDASTGAPTTGEPVCNSPPGVTRDCCCFEKDTDSSLIINDCADLPLCGPLLIRCSPEDSDCPVPGASGGPPAQFLIDDEQTLDCVLQHLDTGTWGLLAWRFQDKTNPERERWFSLNVGFDRDAFVQISDYDGKTGTIGDVTRQALKPSAFFENCKGEPGLRTRALCLIAATTGTIAETCAVGGPHEKP